VSSGGLHIPGVRRPAEHRGMSGASWAGSAFSSPEDDNDHVSEHEADKMSLDGQDDVPARKLPTINRPVDDDDDMTDDEDWESMGPEALRQPSYAGSLASRRGSHVSSSYGRISKPAAIPTSAAPSQRSQQRNPSLPAFSSHAIRSMAYCGGIVPFQRVYSSSLSSSLRMQGVPVQDCGSPQEREAVEALLQMGSM
jgi:hypothetical protein